MQRPCPICGGNARSVLFHQIFTAFSGKSLLSGYDVVTCSQCGCGYADGIPSQSDFDTYYRELSKYEYQHRGGAESAEDLSRFRTITDALAPFVPSPQARILEVGCSTGRLLALLKESGFSHVAGLDPSPFCGEAALRLYGVPVRTGSLDNLLQDPSRVEVLILIGVLEHLRDLRPALRNVCQKLSSHGLVYVEVPDVTGFARFLDAPYQQFSTEHVIFFSPASLSAALAAEGFRPLLVKQDSRPHSGRLSCRCSGGFSRRPSPRPRVRRSILRPGTALESYIHASARVER